MDISDEKQVEEVIEEKVGERVEERLKQERRKIKKELKQQMKDSGKVSKSEDNKMTRRKFLKLLGVGAGGLALSSSAAGLSWSKITPRSRGTSDINAEIASGLTSSALGVGINGGDGTDLSLNESVIKDGGGKEIDVQEFSGGAGSSGEFLKTDGANAIWTAPPVPSGVITMWSGDASNVPSGWTLCDGTDGTPDLRDRFIVGAGNQYSVGNTGGSDEVTLTKDEMPSHSHSGTVVSSVYEGTSYPAMGHDSGANTNGSSSYSTSSEGGNQAHENRPPFYALAYIMKL